MIAGITSETRLKASELVIEMAGIMSHTMTDGIGYAAVNEDGDLFGERWHKSEDAFDVRTQTDIETDTERGIKQSFGKALSVKEKPRTYNSFGDEFKSMDEHWGSISAVTLHGRFATSSKEFKNTHPFVLDDTSLVHNGVIRNAWKLGKMRQSTCDSEVILSLYDEKKVSRWTSNIQGVVDQLEGYFACGMFTRDPEGMRVLDIFKDDTAQLSAAYIDELKTLVFITNVSDLENACDNLGLTISSMFKVEAGNLIRLNPVTGSVISVTEFNFHKSKVANETFKSMRDNRRYSQVDDDGFEIDLDKVLGL
jgi:hypothetical protein